MWSTILLIHYSYYYQYDLIFFKDFRELYKDSSSKSNNK